jgi:hypothetical protein
MKGPILATVALAAMLAGEVPIAQAVVFVRTPPPRPLSVGVVGRSPGPGFVWTGGYWRWGRGRRGRRAGYAWVPGRWRRAPRTGAVWVAPRWRSSRGGYTFVSGRWR